ncbi:MAG: glycoside hydrolase family 16 protein [Acidobacteriaceae bacterium]
MFRSWIQIAGAGLLMVAWMAVPVAVSGERAGGADHAGSKWKLVWKDEFDGPDGSMPDPGKWSIVRQGSGFGNQELEYYTDLPANSHIEGGMLVITARKENFKGADGIVRDYTSARLETAGRFQQKYGRFEARIKLPKGQGIWPAFWLLGDDFSAAGWPACGEIDIMENVGFEPGKIHGTLHGPGYSGSNALTAAYTLPDHEAMSDGFHLFAVEWEPETIRFYVDDDLFETQTADSVPGSKRWAFDHPFYILLNLAVGGAWPGNPDAATPFPATMLVDYVRVYALQANQER